jgi:catechol 2,3-dioxygenase-like lactoylglutathione lyase family enzyme
MGNYPRTFQHLGISVPDGEKAVDFYGKIMGWCLIFKPTAGTEEAETPIGKMRTDAVGTGWGSFSRTHMSTGNKMGIEIFAFGKHDQPADFAYWKTSPFHFCVQDPEVEGLAGRIAAHGGRQRMPIRAYDPEEKPYGMATVEDPSRPLVESHAHSYPATYSQGAY